MGVLLSATRRNTASVTDLRSLFKPLENKSSANLPPFLSSAYVGLSEAEVSIILHEIKLCCQLIWHCNSIPSEFIKNEVADYTVNHETQTAFIKVGTKYPRYSSN